MKPVSTTCNNLAQCGFQDHSHTLRMMLSQAVKKLSSRSSGQCLQSPQHEAACQEDWNALRPSHSAQKDTTAWTEASTRQVDHLSKFGLSGNGETTCRSHMRGSSNNLCSRIPAAPLRTFVRNSRSEGFRISAVDHKAIQWRPRNTYSLHTPVETPRSGWCSCIVAGATTSQSASGTSFQTTKEWYRWPSCNLCASLRRRETDTTLASICDAVNGLSRCWFQQSCKHPLWRVARQCLAMRPSDDLAVYSLHVMYHVEWRTRANTRDYALQLHVWLNKGRPWRCLLPWKACEATTPIAGVQHVN